MKSKLVIESAWDVISLLSAEGHILCASPLTSRVFGYFPDEIIGRRAIDLVHPDDRSRVRRALAAVLIHPPDPRRVEMRVLQQDGEWGRMEAAIFNLLYEPCIGGILVNCRRIGSRKTAKSDKRYLVAEEVNTSGPLEDFACAVANDLRGPLGTISMFAERLIGQAGLDSCATQQAEFIADGVARMSALLGGLQAFAAGGMGEPAPRLDLGQLVARVLEDLRHVIRSGNATVTVDSMPFVRGNGEQLARVFQNLIINAIKHRSDTPVRIHVSAERLAKGWTIRIEDNGVGIPAGEHRHVFSPFRQPYGSETPGAGLGLAICRKIIESAGGAIWVESAPGSGPVFCFTVEPAPGENAGSPLGDREPGIGETMRTRIFRDRILLKGIRAASARKPVPPVEITRFANGR